MRALTITNWYPPHHFGGYELSCADVTRRLVARGIDVDVLCADTVRTAAPPPEPDHERRVHRELRVHLDQHGPTAATVRERWAIDHHNRRTVKRILDAARPDVVAVWHMAGLSLSVIREVQRREIPIVYAVCDDWLIYGPDLDRWATLLPARVLPDIAAGATVACFVSDHTRAKAARLSRWRFERDAVVGSGVDTSLFTDRGRAERGWRGRIVALGRYDPRKGFDTIVRALPALPDAHAHIAGHGGAEERARLGALATELGVADRVELGAHERAELPEVYRRADVVVFPSVWDEPFGLVPLEAMACGTPVIATGVGGSGSYLADGRNCVLVAPDDPAALVGAVQRLAVDPAGRAALVAGGKATVSAYDVERLTDAFEAWYRAAARRFAAPLPPRRRSPRVRVGIVSYETAAPLDRCLAALPQALDGLDADVVVVDNASRDASVTVASRHGGVVVVRNDENEGYARAMNTALRGGGADVLIALNPDTEPPPGSLRTLVDRLLDAPDIGLVAPRLESPTGEPQHSAYRFPSVAVAGAAVFASRRFGARLWLEGRADHARRVDVDWAIGAVHVLRPSAAREWAGGPVYDESWFVYGEDLDLCWRLAEAGWRRRLEGDVAVAHVGGAAGGRLPHRWLVPTYEVVARHRGERRARVWAAANTVGVGWLVARTRSADLRAALAVHRHVLVSGTATLRRRWRW